MGAEPFEVVDWPLGRACASSEGGLKQAYNWAYVANAEGKAEFAEQVSDILGNYTKEVSSEIAKELYLRMERAKEGACKRVIWKNGKRVQSGEVDRMGYGTANVLELIVHNKLPGDPKFCLRLYFVEPRTRYDLVAISAGKKPATREGKKTQDEQWLQADESVRQWWGAQVEG